MWGVGLIVAPNRPAPRKYSLVMRNQETYNKTHRAHYMARRAGRSTLLESIAQSGWLTTRTVAEHYGLGQTTVKNAILAGRLKAIKFARYYLIEPEDAEYWFKYVLKKTALGETNKYSKQLTGDTNGRNVH